MTRKEVVFASIGAFGVLVGVATSWQFDRFAWISEVEEGDIAHVQSHAAQLKAAEDGITERAITNRNIKIRFERDNMGLPITETQEILMRQLDAAYASHIEVLCQIRAQRGLDCDQAYFTSLGLQ